ncbi:MAG TPA: ABC transporter permease [Planctomycetota bacterium]|nr:ABC transporter permease [Planctomycetota bacterium]
MTATSPGIALPAATLAWRDVVRFFRQRSRIVGALASPLLFWVVIGSGIGTSFRPAGDPATSGYLGYFFPGTLVLVVLFTAIFSTISVIEDRREGFLQAVLVSPAPRAGVVLGKLLGGTILGVSQGALFLLVGPIAGVMPEPARWPLVLAVLVLTSFGLTGLGFVIAWSLDSIQGFHAIMNLVLVPLWLLSGALFPPSGASGWIRAIMAANPVTYGVAAVRRTLTDGPFPDDLPTLATSIAVSAAFGAALFAASVAIATRRTGKVGV